MVCSRSRPDLEQFEAHRDLAKNSISQIEEWATKCLVKAKKLREINLIEKNESTLDKILHLEMEADYWFGLATAKKERWFQISIEKARKRRDPSQTKLLEQKKP